MVDDCSRQCVVQIVDFSISVLCLTHEMDRLAALYSGQVVSWAMSAVGSCTDNPLVEGLFGIPKRVRFNR